MRAEHRGGAVISAAGVEPRQVGHRGRRVVALAELAACQVCEQCRTVVTDSVVSAGQEILEHGRGRVPADTCVHAGQVSEHRCRIEPEPIRGRPNEPEAPHCRSPLPTRWPADGLVESPNPRRCPRQSRTHAVPSAMPLSCFLVASADLETTDRPIVVAGRSGWVTRHLAQLIPELGERLGVRCAVGNFG